MEDKSFETEVLTRLTKIETKIDDYKNIKERAETSLTLAKSNEKDILELKDKIKWLSRTIGASIIGGLLAIAFIYLKELNLNIINKNFIFNKK